MITINKKVLKIILAGTFAFSAVLPVTTFTSENEASAQVVKEKKAKKYQKISKKTAIKKAKKAFKKSKKNYKIKKATAEKANNNSYTVLIFAEDKKTKKEYSFQVVVKKSKGKFKTKVHGKTKGFVNAVG